MFHARGPAVAKERSPNDESVRGTATVIDSADLRPALALAAADGVQVGWCVAVQTTMNNRTFEAQSSKLTAAVQNAKTRVHLKGQNAELQMTKSLKRLRYVLFCYKEIPQRTSRRVNWDCFGVQRLVWPDALSSFLTPSLTHKADRTARLELRFSG